MLTQLIDSFKSFENEKTQEYKESIKIQKDYTIILEKSKEEYSKKNFFKRLFACSKEKKELRDFTQFLENEKLRSETLLKEIQSKKKSLFDDTVNQFINVDTLSVKKLGIINDRISYIMKIYNTFSKTVKAGERALSEINEALRAIDSAETTETLDLFTNNKAISIMSSFDLDTAKNETREANQYIKKFQEELEYTKMVMKEIEMDTSWGTFDFIIDMSDAGFLDMFGSLMVLDSLSNAENKLKEAKKIVEKALNIVKEEFVEISKQKNIEESVKDDFMKNFKIKATNYLKENSILI